MKRVVMALVLAVAAVAALEAAFFDFEQITVDNTSGGVKLTAAKVAVSLDSVSCRVRTAEISFLTVDPNKTTVTSTVGQLAEIGDQIVITSREEALNLRAIRTGATSGQLDCTYRTRQAP
jgi:hypothetical protein